MKINWLLIFLGITIIGSIGSGISTYFIQREDQNQKDKIQSLISENLKLSTKEGEENLATGRLKLDFTPSFSPIDEFTLDIGFGLTIPTKRILAGDIFNQILPGLNYEPVKIDIRDGKLVISLKIFDINGNLIAEVKDNYWRPNKNFSGRFNYDDYGFEVIDNQGNIAVSIDIITNNRVAIQGVFRSQLQKLMVISSGQTFMAFPFNNPTMDSNFRKTGADPDKASYELISSIKPLFEYFDEDWLHKRLHPRRKVLTNDFFNPNNAHYPRPKTDLLIPFTDTIINFKSKDYKVNFSSVDDRKPERVLLRVKNWNNNTEMSTMMLEKTGGENGDQWRNSRPLDIDDEDFINTAIKVLTKLIDDHTSKSKK